MKIFRLLFLYHLTGFPIAFFIILTIIIIISSVIYKRRHAVFQDYYLYSQNNVSIGNTDRVLCNLNVFLNRAIPWIVLICANFCYLIPFITYITIGCIAVNLAVIILLMKYDNKFIRECDEKRGLNKGLFIRLLAFLCCMHQIYYAIKPYMKGQSKANSTTTQ